MNVFLLDLWHDLREKRLLPVALLLAAGLIAVPVLLLKSASGGSEAPPPAAAAAKPGGPSVIAALDDQAGTNSDLGVFNPKDPFKSSLPVNKPGAGTAKVQGSPVSPAGGGGGASTSSTTGGGSSGGTASQPTGTTPPPVKHRVTFYQYVVDLEFGKRGQERKRKGVKRLQLLPNDKHPMLVFLGVSSDRKKAVFLVDSSLSQSGEGTCKPDVDTCTFLYLTTSERHNEHFLTTDDGQEYVVRLLAIRREKISSKKSSKAKSSRHTRRSSRHTRPERRPSGPASIFHSLLFTDEQR